MLLERNNIAFNLILNLLKMTHKILYTLKKIYVHMYVLYIYIYIDTHRIDQIFNHFVGDQNRNMKKISSTPC